MKWLAKFSCAFFLNLCCVLVLPGGMALAADEERWTLDAALGLPEWLSITGEHLTRYETLNSQFRANSTGSDQILSLRTLVQAEVRFNKNFRIKAELQDSRAKLADTGSRMNNSIVNAAELLEAYFNWSTEDLFSQGSRSELRGGRLTMDVGNRRLVARNRFRNVIQSYTGLDWKWTAKEGNQFQVFFTLPVNRQPADIPSLLENETEFDEETTDQILWGIWYTHPQLSGNTKGEIFILGLHEDDDSDFVTRNRQLYTPGFRLYRPSKKTSSILKYNRCFSLERPEQRRRSVIPKIWITCLTFTMSRPGIASMHSGRRVFP